jgi:hypothetical protein
MEVLLDFDSTVFPLLDAMRACEGGERISYADMPTYGALVERSGGLERMLELFALVMPFEAMRPYAPFAGCVDWLTRLSAAGARLHLVTDRPDELADDVARYLEAHGVTVASLRCQLGIDKLTIVLDEGIELAIDDHPEFIAKLAATSAQAAALCFPYNREIIDRTGAIAGANWDELGPQLLAFVEDQV